MMTGEAGTPVYIRYLLALGQNVSTTSSLVAEVVVVVVVVDMISRVQRMERKAGKGYGGGREDHSESLLECNIYCSLPSIIHGELFCHSATYSGPTARERCPGAGCRLSLRKRKRRIRPYGKLDGERARLGRLAANSYRPRASCGDAP